MLSKVLLPFAFCAALMAAGDAHAAAAVAGAASGSEAAASAPATDLPLVIDPVQERIRMLEETIVRLQRDNQDAQDALEAAQTRLREIEAGRRGNLLTYVLAAMVLVLTGALYGLLRRQGHKSRWWAGGRGSEQSRSSQMVGGDSSVASTWTWPPSMPPQMAAPAAAASPERPAASPAKPQGADSDTHPAPFTTTSAPAKRPGPAPSLPGLDVQFSSPSGQHPHDATVDDLIDVDQQVEFFAVLGQDDAAVELLMEHLGGAAGGSPLPYLRLLDIHRTRDERDAFERVRARFQQAFGAAAPEWDAVPARAGGLEAQPLIVERLQAVWSDPAQAMQELQAMLWRLSPQAAPLDLPACREALFLYAVARDVSEHTDPANVDLLL